MGEKQVSVVIPTYNRRERLVGCLEAIARQTLPREHFEVIVASDGSTDGTAEAAHSAAGHLGLDLVVEEVIHGGAAHARNAGVQRARAPVIAFTDDDVRVAPGWLEAGLAAFADPEVGGVEGRTEAELGPESLYKFNVSNRAGGIYPTCNIFYRREALAQVGGFDERFRRAREDSDLAFRVMASGHRIVFAPAAGAVHRSHHTSTRIPLFIASTLPDSILLWSKHPGQDTLRPRFYRSDAVKIGLAIAAVAAALMGAWWLAGGLVLGFALLIARTLLHEVVIARALRPDRLLALVAVYSAVPFANLWHYTVGTLRVRRGAEPTRPVGG